MTFYMNMNIYISKKVTEKFHTLQVFCLRCVALVLGCLLYVIKVL